MLSMRTFLDWKHASASASVKPSKPVDVETSLEKLHNLSNKISSRHCKDFLDKLKCNTITCMLYDQENQLKVSEKQLEMEEAFNQLVKENEAL